MRLYHGSNITIENVDVSRCRPYKDFGRGFYLTDICEQAEKMAKRVARIYGGEPYVTEFEFNERALEDAALNVRVFEAPTKEWAIFVINNRNRLFGNIKDRECNQDNKYDIVLGPVANDDLALLFRQFSSGLIDEEILVRAMQYKKLTSQFSFHSDTALRYLTKVG